MNTMAKRQPKEPKETKKFPSRDGYSGTYLPRNLYDELKTFAEKDERSTAHLVRKACEAYLVFLKTGAFPETKE